MEITFSVEELQKVVNKVVMVIPNRSTIDDLMNFKITVTSAADSMVILGTNQEIYLQSEIKVKSKDDIAFCVDANKFTKALNALPADKVGKLKVDDEHIVVTAGKTKHQIKRFGVEKYSYYPQGVSGKPLKIERFADMMKVFKPIFGGGDETLSQGVFFLNDEIVALDGERGAWFKLKGNIENSADGFMVSARAAKLLDKYDTVEVSYDQLTKTAFFLASDIKLWARDIDIGFPKGYAQSVWEDEPMVVTVNTENFRTALSRVIQTALDEISTKVNFVFGKKKIVISAGDGITESSDETEVIDSNATVDMKRMIKGKFVADMLGTINLEDVEIKLKDGSKTPLIVKYAGQEEIPESKNIEKQEYRPAFTYVIQTLAWL